MDVERKQTPGGKTGSTPKVPTKGVEKGAKSTDKRIDKQERSK